MNDSMRQDMTTQLERMIDAAEARAEKYDGDDRQHIKTDVMNAFYAGAKWQSENLEQEPVCYMQENQPYVYVSETKNEGSGYTIPLYTSPPNAKAIEAAARELMIEMGWACRGIKHDITKTELLAIVDRVLKSK